MELQSETILDLKAFNRLFGEYQQRFIRFAGTYVSDAATAEDIVMESFMAAWEKRDMLSASAFPPYALTIVKNKCLNHLRSQGVRLRAAEDIHSHGARMLRTRISEGIDHALWVLQQSADFQYTRNELKDMIYIH